MSVISSINAVSLKPTFMYSIIFAIAAFFKTLLLDISFMALVSVEHCNFWTRPYYFSLLKVKHAWFLFSVLTHPLSCDRKHDVRPFWQIFYSTGGIMVGLLWSQALQGMHAKSCWFSFLLFCLQTICSRETRAPPPPPHASLPKMGNEGFCCLTYILLLFTFLWCDICELSKEFWVKRISATLIWNTTHIILIVTESMCRQWLTVETLTQRGFSLAMLTVCSVAPSG